VGLRRESLLFCGLFCLQSCQAFKGGKLVAREINAVDPAVVHQCQNVIRLKVDSTVLVNTHFVRLEFVLGGFGIFIPRRNGDVLFHGLDGLE